MRAEDHPRACGNLRQFLDENRSGLPQFIDDVPIVHDLLTHVHGRAVHIEDDLDHIDGPHHPGAESARPQ